MARDSVLILLFASFVAGCNRAPYYKEPVIADLEEDKVVVEWMVSELPGNIFARKNSATLDDVKRVAEDGCAIHRKTAVAISNKCGVTVFVQSVGNVCAAYHYLFACKEVVE